MVITIFLVRLIDFQYYKIGFTRCWEDRLISLEGSTPFCIELITLYQSPKAREIEGQLHCKYASKRIKGEWFRLSKKDVAQIKKAFDNSPNTPLLR